MVTCTGHIGIHEGADGRTDGRTTSTSSPGSTPLSRWRVGEDPGTHRYTSREILHKSWSILSRDTNRISFSLHLISGSRNQKWLKI